MTMFIGQKELLSIVRNQLQLPENVKLKINLKLNKYENEYVWLDENGEYELDLKKETINKLYLGE